MQSNIRAVAVASDRYRLISFSCLSYADRSTAFDFDFNEIAWVCILECFPCCFTCISESKTIFFIIDCECDVFFCIQYMLYIPRYCKSRLLQCIDTILLADLLIVLTVSIHGCFHHSKGHCNVRCNGWCFNAIKSILTKSGHQVLNLFRGSTINCPLEVLIKNCLLRFLYFRHCIYSPLFISYSSYEFEISMRE